MAMKTALGLLLMVLTTRTASAQTAPVGRPWPATVAHVAKWPLLGATAAMLARGFLFSRDAERWQDSVIAACAPIDPCPQSSSGRYLLPGAQAAHESYLEANNRARTWIVGGELALVATGAVFLIDLIHRDEGPRNIPFTPFTIYAAPRRLGFTARF